jgi:3-deoxy-D-manno-octulosonic-acid transferase
MLRFDLIYFLILACLSPFILLKILFDARFRKTFLARLHPNLDVAKQTLNHYSPQNNIWVHAASIGEAGLAAKLIHAWKVKNPSYQFILSVGTLSGFDSFSQNSDIPVILAPLDFSFMIKRVQRRFKASHLILIETEIWPNMIDIMAKIGMVTIVNGRLSDKHYGQYYRIKRLLKQTMRSITHVLAGDNISQQRFFNLGVDQERIHKFGNMKFELPVIAEFEALKQLQSKYKINPQKPVFVAGSIQPEELNTIISAIQKIENHDIQVIIIPRHPEKRHEFKQILDRLNINAFFTAGSDLSNINHKPNQVLVVDEIGVLRLFYQIASVIFVGGSLCNRGGQNMMEAIGFQKPVCVGPFATNFKQEMDLLLQAEGIKIIQDKETLAQFIIFSLDQKSEAEEMALQGYRLIKDNSGALESTIDFLGCAISKFSSRESYESKRDHSIR